MKVRGSPILALGMAFLAGCTVGPSAEPGPSDPILVTDPADRSTAGDNRPHIHDYWQGRERVTLVRESRNSGGLISNCAGWSWEVFRSQPPRVVYQGTSRVEVTLTWQDATGDAYTDPELWIKTTADNAPRLVTNAVSGQKVVFESRNESNDRPHNILSAWEFHWVIHPGNPNDPSCLQSFSGHIEIQVEIIRGLEIPLFEGHPDLWNNQTTLPILEATRDVRFYNGPKPPTSNLCLSEADGCLWSPHRPANGTVVPYDAKRIEVVLKPQNQYPFDLGFAYHGADTWNLTFLDPTEDRGSERLYKMDVGANEGDGPYARQSLWEFWFYPKQDTQSYHGSYTVSASVLRG